MFNHKKIILIVTLTTVILFTYWYFFISRKSLSDLTDSNSSLTQTPKVSGTSYDKDFVTSLIDLKSVNLDLSILDNVTYQYLNFPEVPFNPDYTRPSGRTNPFLPIGVEENSLNNNNILQNKSQSDLDLNNDNTDVNQTSTTSSLLNNNTTNISTTTNATNTKTEVSPKRRSF